MFTLVEILIAILAFCSSFCWWKSARVDFENKDVTIIQNLSGKETARATDANELKDFVRKQAKWNTRAALSAAFAALITGVLLVVKLCITS